MASTISVRLEENMLSELDQVENKWKADRSEVVRRLLGEALEEWKKKETLEKLREHKISIGKASENLKINLYEMIDLAKEYKIDWIGYEEGDVAKELRNLK